MATAAGAVYGLEGFGGSSATASAGTRLRHPRTENGPSTSSTSGSAASASGRGSCGTRHQSSIPVTGLLQLARRSQLPLQFRRHHHLPHPSVAVESSLRWPPPQQEQHLRTSSTKKKVENWTTTTTSREKWRVASAKNSKAADVAESNFDAEVLQSSIPVLVDFWATWCGPCKLMSISLDWAAQEYEGKLKCVKVESDSNAHLVEKYHVYGLPTVILFVNGEPVANSKREGAINKGKLQEYLEKSLPALAPTT